MMLGKMFDYGFNARERRSWVARQAAAVPAGSRVLDAGAGRGQYRAFFDHCEYKAQDFAQEPGTVGHYTQLDYECDITDIPVETGYFDVVLCTEVLEHVPEPIEALRELARVLRPGGMLLCTAPQNAHLHQEPFIFYGGYTRYWYEYFCPRFGLTVQDLQRNRGFFSFFGQEALRFSALLDPRRTLRTEPGGPY
jgi:2-polyprenyl-3-methyl-5-hydroxy-6-metoxy-1,4-benzoquinol methylase